MMTGWIRLCAILPLCRAIFGLSIVSVFWSEIGVSEQLSSESLQVKPPAKSHPELQATVTVEQFISAALPEKHLKGLYDRNGLSKCDMTKAGLGASIDRQGWLDYSCAIKSRSTSENVGHTEITNGVDANLLQAGVDHFGANAGPFVKALATGKIDFTVNILAHGQKIDRTAHQPPPERYVVEYVALPKSQEVAKHQPNTKRIAALSSSQKPGDLTLDFASQAAAENPVPNFEEETRYKKRLVALPAEPLSPESEKDDTLGSADRVREILRSIGFPDGSFERVNGRIERSPGEPDLSRSKLVLEEGSHALVFAEAKPFHGEIAYGFTIPFSKYDFGRVRYGMDGQPTTYRYERGRDGSKLIVEFEDLNSSLKLEAQIPL